MTKHVHDFHALWWNFGQYGRQDVHLHPCHAESCEVELVGAGYDCGGKGTPHTPKTLTSRSRWSAKEQEGQPWKR